jgi:DNA-binding transcriptional LysR family regulator
MKSLTAAAKALSMPKSSVSRKIRSLETRLGSTLLLRTTRALNLTDAGRLFYEKSSLALKELDSAEETVDGSKQEVEGTLKITAPEDFCMGPINAMIASFLTEYPKVNIELLLTSRVVDLIAEGFDLAFRMGDLGDSTLIAKKLNMFQIQFYGSPQYLKANGAPKSLTEIERHNLIGFSPGGTPLKFKFKGPGGAKREITLRGRLTTNNILSAKEAAVNGLGLAALPDYLFRDELLEKSLKVVCPDWSMPATTTHLVFPGQKFLTPRMRAFIDYATKAFSL